MAKEIVAAGWTDLPLRKQIFFSTNELTAPSQLRLKGA
jgi:hypothetical protein